MKFPVIRDQKVIEEILKEGFNHLDNSPFFGLNAENIIIVKRLSLDETMCNWFLYDKEMNKQFITTTDTEGWFEIKPMAKSFVSIASSDGFLQIHVKTMSFNHLKAIECYREIIEKS